MKFENRIINSNIFSFINKNNNNDYPSCRIISSLFTKDYNDSLNNSQNKSEKKIIYNIKENSIFLIKIFGQYIKYYPIFNELTNYEKYINYNPLLELNPNFEIISNNNNEIHFEFYIKNYKISMDKFEKIKEKYIKHNFTKKNITHPEDIFKYLFEEIKININLINVENKYEENLKFCSKLINNINEIIEEIIDKDKFCLFNNDKIKKNIILNAMNSKSIEYNFLQNDTIKEKNENTNNELLLNENK